MNIPMKRLYTGAEMPGIGLGTFGSDHVSAEDVAKAVAAGIEMGYRYIDCAACYGNEKEVGEAINAAIAGGVDRGELFILSKVWNDKHGYDNVIAACKKTLEDLGLDYLDCYLVHWPFPNYHPPFCDVDTRNPDSRPYIHEEFMDTWRAMEDLVDMGLVKHIGTSNVTIPKMEMILRDARIKPAVNELELHPTFQQGELYQYLIDHDIVPIGYSPIGSPARPERDRTPEDIVDIDMPEMRAIAEKHGMHPATLCVKWASQRGQVPIPFSTNPRNMLANLKAACEDDMLTAEEMNIIRGLDRNCRLIKGQVFLWEGAGSWLDLWDADGTIPGWNGYEKG